MVVYKITNKINGRSYVGITRHDAIFRIRNHFSVKRSGAPLLKKAMLKHGIKNFEWSVIDIASSIDELCKKEVLWIKKLKTMAPRGYNILPGGYTNGKAIEKLKRRIVRVDTGEEFSSLVEASVSTGVSRNLITFSVIGRQDRAGGIPFRYKDKKLFQKAEKRRKSRPKNMIKIPVICVTTGQRFSSVQQAARSTGAHRNSILRVCKGIGKLAKGMIFKYARRKI